MDYINEELAHQGSLKMEDDFTFLGLKWEFLESLGIWSEMLHYLRRFDQNYITRLRTWKLKGQWSQVSDNIANISVVFSEAGIASWKNSDHHEADRHQEYDVLFSVSGPHSHTNALFSHRILWQLPHSCSLWKTLWEEMAALKCLWKITCPWGQRCQRRQRGPFLVSLRKESGEEVLKVTSLGLFLLWGHK